MYMMIYSKRNHNTDNTTNNMTIIPGRQRGPCPPGGALLPPEPDGSSAVAVPVTVTVGGMGRPRPPGRGCFRCRAGSLPPALHPVGRWRGGRLWSAEQRQPPAGPVGCLYSQIHHAHTGPNNNNGNNIMPAIMISAPARRGALRLRALPARPLPCPGLRRARVRLLARAPQGGQSRGGGAGGPLRDPGAP